MKTNNSASTPTSSSPIYADIISIIFARLILHCGIKDHCWPGDHRLAIDLRLNVDQVAAALNELVDEARIRIEYQGLRRFIYIIQNTQAANTPSPQKPTPITSSSGSKEGEVQEGKSNGAWRHGVVVAL